MKQLLLLSFFSLFAWHTLGGQCTFDPTISVSPEKPNFIYCPYDVVTLSTETYDSYQWYSNFTNSNIGGTPISGATGQEYVVDVSEWGFAYFYVEATKDGCTEASPTQIIDSWLFLPVVIQSSGQPTYCEGDSTEILVPGSGFSSYQWYRNGQPIPGATNQNYWVTESGTYTVEAAYAICPELTSNSGVGPSFDFLPVETPTVTLSGDTLMADGGGQLQWLLNGQLIAGATGPTWVAQVSGMYSVFYMNANGCSGETEPIQVTLTSVREVSAADVRIFPNPAKEMVWVESDENISQIRLLDMQGRLVRVVERGRGELLEMPLHGLSSGLYGVQVVLADGNTLITQLKKE